MNMTVNNLRTISVSTEVSYRITLQLVFCIMERVINNMLQSARKGLHS